MSTQRLEIDLERNEELQKIAADIEPGAKLKATLSVVSKDDRILTVELEEVEEPSGSSDADDEDEEEDDSGGDDEGGDTPAMKVARGK